MKGSLAGISGSYGDGLTKLEPESLPLCGIKSGMILHIPLLD